MINAHIVLTPDMWSTASVNYKTLRNAIWIPKSNERPRIPSSFVKGECGSQLYEFRMTVEDDNSFIVFDPGKDLSKSEAILIVKYDNLNCKLNLVVDKQDPCKYEIETDEIIALLDATIGTRENMPTRPVDNVILILRMFI